MFQPTRRAKRVKVLIVDQSEDNQEVLAAALAARGVEALAAADAAEGLRLVSESAPDLIVLDVESLPDQAAGGDDAFETAARGFGQRLILLSGVRRETDRFGGGSVVAKPYHYGPLIRTIEGLLKK